MQKNSQTPDMLTIYKDFHEVMDKPGFLPLLQCAYKIFNAPVLFTDEHYSLVSLYPASKIGDPVYDTLFETGSLPIETITAFQEAYLKDPGIRYEPFFAKDGLVKERPRIFAEVYDDKKILGHIEIFINSQKVKSWQLEAAAALTSALRIKLNLTRHFTPTLSRNLNDLLNRDSPNLLKDKSMANISQTRKFPGILLVALLDQNKAQQAFANVALNYCLHKFPSAIPTIYNNDLVILIADKKKQHTSSVKKIAEEIAVFLSQYEVRCGAVYPVENLYLLPDHYLQGRLTAKLMPQGMAYYDKVMPEPLYLYLSELPECVGFIHPALKMISAYDRDNETEFLPTLKCYCQCLFQKNEASEQLHVHRNTLLYRLNRMEELFGLDLKDVNTLEHLMISFGIERYQVL